MALDEQRALATRCRALMDGPAGGYVPTVRGGGTMRVRMLCLGRHWNARTYTYEATRGDFDGAAVEPLPPDLAALAQRIAADAGHAFAPDLCIMNWYSADGRMGLHQDKGESRASIEAGLPVVSVSIGDTARFLFGGLRRRDPVQTLLLESGDVFVFGGPARLRYHGVSRIIPGTAPPALGIDGRFNLTFREY
jgi:alkylated DNA repair protein (DNA oxidative demethylase)